MTGWSNHGANDKFLHLCVRGVRRSRCGAKLRDKDTREEDDCERTYCPVCVEIDKADAAEAAEFRRKERERAIRTLGYTVQADHGDKGLVLVPTASPDDVRVSGPSTLIVETREDILDLLCAIFSNPRDYFDERLSHEKNAAGAWELRGATMLRRPGVSVDDALTALGVKRGRSS